MVFACKSNRHSWQIGSWHFSQRYLCASQPFSHAWSSGQHNRIVFDNCSRSLTAISFQTSLFLSNCGTRDGWSLSSQSVKFGPSVRNAKGVPVFRYRRVYSSIEKFFCRLPGGRENSHLPDTNSMSLLNRPVDTFTRAQAKHTSAFTQSSL